MSLRTSWRAPTFIPDARVVGGDSCDELPFAATGESGNRLGLTGPDCAEVRPFISDTTGRWVVAKYPRVDDAERCIRGHVAGADNSDVGSRLGAFAQSQRLLDLDPYWLAVTA